MKKISVLLLFFILIVILIAEHAIAKDYVIGGGDTLQISVWGSPELSSSVIVRPDGKISIPALGEIKASGLTPKELAGVLEKEMTKIIKMPIVTVIVTSMTNYRIFVFGKGVSATGVKTLATETTLLELLSQLGPLDNADLENAYLIRDKKKIKQSFSRLFEKGDYSQDVVLEPNDMLFIPDNFENRISIVGAVNRPTTIPYRAGLTILDVILSAGGFTAFAQKNDVLLIRKGTDGNGDRVKTSVKVKELMQGDLSHNIALMPADCIVVKESLF